MGEQEVFIKTCEPSGALHFGVTASSPSIVLMQPSSVDEQIWVMQRVNNTSEFMIMNKATGKYIDARMDPAPAAPVGLVAHNTGLHKIRQNTFPVQVTLEVNKTQNYIGQSDKNTNKISQRWYVGSDGRLCTVQTRSFITVESAGDTSGDTQGCKPNQKLKLQDYAPYDIRQTFLIVPLTSLCTSCLSNK